MAVLTNTMLQGSSAVEEAAEDYQIENSLRFSEDDSAYLSRTFATKGNRRTWTWSAWIKLGKLEDDGYLFAARSSTDNRLYLKYNSTGTLYGYTGNSDNKQFETTRKLRDPSAWYSIVWVWDSTNDIERDRQRVYINGERTTNTQTNSYNQNFEGAINDTIGHCIGNQAQETTYFDGYIANVHFIDGLALSPAAFGSFDSTGAWNPKAFALPAPNDGTTWSGKMSGSFDGSNNAAKVFDGDLSTYAYPGAGNTVTFTPDNPISCTSLRVYTRNDANGGGVKVNGIYQGDVTTTPTWYDYTPDSHSITSISWRRESSGSIGCQTYAIEIDGVILVDGQTDPTARNNPNNGIKWSSNTCSGTPYSGQAFTSAFDGSSTTYVHSEYPGVLKWVPPSTITGRLRCLIACGAHGGSVTGNFDFKINGVSKFNNSTFPNNTSAWVDFGEVSIAAGGDGIEWGSQTGGNWMAMRIIEIDGNPLLDDATDNSFHLKLNDTVSNTSLGRDSIKKLSDETIGLPIYNTDDSGAVKGSGYRTDSNSSYLELAVPGDSVASGTCDVHQQINTGSSNRTATVSGSVVKTDVGGNYNAALFFDGTDDKISFANTADLCDMGTGDFTWECWVKPTGGSNSTEALMGTRNASGSSTGSYLYLYGSTANVRFHWRNSSNGTADIELGNNIACPADQWSHIAVVRHGTKLTLYLNGLDHSATSGGTNPTTVGTDAMKSDAGAFTIGGSGIASNFYAGYMQDVRVYKGVAKYTAQFAPPIRNDLTVNNITKDDGTSNFTTSGYTVEKPDGTEVSDTVVQNLFDGNSSTYANLTASNSTWSFLHFNTPLTGVQNLRVWCQGTGPIGYNGGSHGTLSNTSGGAWVWLLENANPAVTVNNIRAQTQPGAGVIYLWQIEVNGTVLTDSSTWASSDSFVDSPTNYGTDNGNGGEVRGNYCTLNPLQSDLTSLIEGNLDYTNTGGWKEALGTIGVTSGKWYYEVECVGGDGDGNSSVGFAWKNNPSQTGAGSVDYAVMLENSGWDQNFSTSKTNRNIDIDEGDILGVSLDLDAGTPFMRTWVNNGSQHTINLGGTWSAGKALFPYVNSNNTGARWRKFNFGQRAFKYAAPSGFKCLCTQNFDDTFTGNNINNPSKFFDVKTWTGTGSAGHNIQGFNFQPDMVWLKRRDSAGGHHLRDAIRGATKSVFSNTNEVEGTDANIMSAFTSDGFTLGNGDNTNANNGTFVGWACDAGSSVASTSNNGSATNYTRWTNATAGFSIIKATISTGSGYHQKTIDHGLNVPPEFILGKGLDAAENWLVYHSSIGTSGVLHLNDDAATDTSTSWKYTAISNTQFTFDSYGAAQNMIYYVWASIPGYSAFGKYDGNGAKPFVYTGFRPKFILLKGTTAGRNWIMVDAERQPYNGDVDALYANTNGTEQNHNALDFLSNGFKIVDDGYSDYNVDADIIYAAWAEHPFKTTRAK